jgi:hypothetical protein
LISSPARRSSCVFTRMIRSAGFTEHRLCCLVSRASMMETASEAGGRLSGFQGRRWPDGCGGRRVFGQGLAEEFYFADVVSRSSACAAMAKIAMLAAVASRTRVKAWLSGLRPARATGCGPSISAQSSNVITSLSSATSRDRGGQFSHVAFGLQYSRDADTEARLSAHVRFAHAASISYSTMKHRR